MNSHPVVIGRVSVPHHPEQSHWCCGCGNYELSVFSEPSAETLRIKCKRCNDWMRLGTHKHDARLEPDDSVLADLQAEIVRQRENDEHNMTVEKYAHECSAEELLTDAAVLLRAYELKKTET